MQVLKSVSFVVMMFMTWVTISPLFAGIAPDFSNINVIDDATHQLLERTDPYAIYGLCADPKTSPVVLDWIVDNAKSRDCGARLYTNPALGMDTIERILAIYNDRPDPDVYAWLVGHSNINPATRARIIDETLADMRRYFKVADSIAREEAETRPGDMRLLHAMAHSESRDFRLEAARSPKLSPELIDYFIESDEILLRSHLTYNAALTLEQLTQLANDEYRPVHTAALSAIKRRFAESYESVAAALAPGAGVLKAHTLQYALGEALKQQDDAAIDKYVAALKRYNLKPHYEAGIGGAMATGDESLVVRVHEAFPDHYLAYQLAQDDLFDAEWLALFLEKGWLDRFGDFEIIHAMTDNYRWVLYWQLVKAGYDANPKHPRSGTSLLGLTVFTPAVIFLAPIVLPLLVILASILYTAVWRQVTVVTPFLVTASSLVFLPAMALWFVAIGLGCWGCADPFGELIMVLALWGLLVGVFVVLSRRLKKYTRV